MGINAERSLKTDNLKKTVAANLIALRKKAGLTQAELASKLNYSDKAVSKWERGESVPDASVLLSIASLYGVSVDWLLACEHPAAAPVTTRHDRVNRLIITMLSVALVWLIATIVFVVLELIPVESQIGIWIVYVYAVPVSCIVLIVFNSLWGKRKRNFLIISALVWSMLASVYVSFLPLDLYLIFIIGIPAQLIVILWSNLKSPADRAHT
ncbi:MAG: helix-turn-helix transcriptional regulator [Oscillospiraceae bacterium]|nr:helix-turn-helix transcriptional regulator [Oscillospiraceae bacterium]